MIYDAKGSPIGMSGTAPGTPEQSVLHEVAYHSPGPRLTTEGAFEGPVTMKIYQDAIECTAHCVHCGGVVKGLIHLHGETQITDERTKKLAKAAMCDRVQREHQCPILNDGKTDIEDFERRLH